MLDTDRKRLAAILGMLGSNSAGERDNAARLAEEFRRQHGLTWEDMLSPAAAESVAKPAADPQFRQWSPYEQAQFFNEHVRFRKVVLQIVGWLMVLFVAFVI